MGRSWKLLNLNLIPRPSPSFLLLAVLGTKLAKLNMWVEVFTVSQRSSGLRLYVHVGLILAHHTSTYIFFRLA